jgi:hypothetical protein
LTYPFLCWWRRIQGWEILFESNSQNQRLSLLCIFFDQTCFYFTDQTCFYFRFDFAESRLSWLFDYTLPNFYLCLSNVTWTNSPCLHRL